MEVLSTQSCLCCGVATSDYLEHLLEFHKFNLARAREVIGGENFRKNVEPAATEDNVIICATNTTLDSSTNVLRIGGVPITLPTGGQGRNIYIHLNIEDSDPSEGQEVKKLGNNDDGNESRTQLITPNAAISSTYEKSSKRWVEWEADNSDDEIVILQELGSSNSEMATEPNMSKDRKGPAEGTTLYSKNSKNNQPDDGTKQKNRKLTCVPLINKLDEVNEMFKYDKLMELVQEGEFDHCCKICHTNVQNIKVTIHEHVSKEHDINLLQYYALYFKQTTWSSVSTVCVRLFGQY